MAIQSKEFVGIAEGIKSHELSTKGKIESLRGAISELSGQRMSLGNRISYLEAALAAAYEDTDEDGDPDYGRISAIEAQISVAESELSAVEGQLDVAHGELSHSEAELESVMEEKAQTLFEIQERARKTSSNIAVAGGMYGAYSGVGSSLQSSMQTSLASLSQAASILDGSVDGFAGGGSGGRDGGSTGGRGVSSSGDISTSALSAFAPGNTAAPVNGTTSRGASPSDFSTHHTNTVTPATASGFHSSKKSSNPQKTSNFNSQQSGNSYAVSAFSDTNSDVSGSQASNFNSSQNPTKMESRFTKGGKKNNMTDWERTSLRPEEEAILREMEENGELDVRPSQMSHSSVDMSVPRLSKTPIEIDMPYSDTTDKEAFLGQGYMQEDGINSMTVDEYLSNYESRTQNGRAPEGTETQKEYRYVAIEVTAADLMSENPDMSYEDARNAAKNMFRKSAALHNPDQIAGGDPTNIHAIGSGHVNSAFGSLWGHGRAEQLHSQVVELSKNMTDEERKNTYLHVRLNMHPKGAKKESHDELERGFNLGALASKFTKGKHQSQSAPVTSVPKNSADIRNDFIQRLQVDVEPVIRPVNFASSSTDDDDISIGARVRVRQPDREYERGLLSKFGLGYQTSQSTPASTVAAEPNARNQILAGKNNSKSSTFQTPRSLSKTAESWTKGAGNTVTYNTPIETGKKLDFHQGKVQNFEGTCGLVSCVNVLRMSGVSISEADVVKYASTTYEDNTNSFLASLKRKTLCTTNSAPSSNGGTSAASRKKILDHFGIPSRTAPQSIETIAQAVSSGHGVIASVHAETLYFRRRPIHPDLHAITITSVQKDNTGKILGFYVCDSNSYVLGGTGATYYTADEISEALSDRECNITTTIIR